MRDRSDTAEAVLLMHSTSDQLARQATYITIVPLEDGLLAAPASQGYVERVFSLCGLLTAGRHNRMSQLLDTRTLLKLNGHVDYCSS